MENWNPEVSVVWPRHWFKPMPKPQHPYVYLIQLEVPNSDNFFTRRGCKPGDQVEIELITSFDQKTWFAWVRGLECFQVITLSLKGPVDSNQ